MAYLLTNCNEFLKQKLNEATSTTYDADKINCLRLKMNDLKRKLALEKDYNKKKRLQMEIKVCELKIMISQIR